MAAITPLSLDIALQTGALVPLLDERVGSPGELLTKVDGTKDAAEAAKDQLQDPQHGLAAIKIIAKDGTTAATEAEKAATGAKAAAETAKNELQDPKYGLAAIKVASVPGTALRIACYLADLEDLIIFAEDKPDDVRSVYDSDFNYGRPYREQFITEVEIIFGRNVQDAVRSAHAELDSYVTSGQKAAKGHKQLVRFELTNHLRAMRRALVGS